MFVQTQYGTCFMSPFWSLDFEVVSVFLENVYIPDYRQYGQNFLNSLSLIAAVFVKFIINKYLLKSLPNSVYSFKYGPKIPDDLEICLNIFAVEACGQMRYPNP